jgi:PleD family two-component response regulator
LFYYFRLEDQVPEHHQLRVIEKHINRDFDARRMMAMGIRSLELDGCMATLKLLVVEDDIASLELMAEVFTSLDAEVRPLSDSQKAANVINQEKFDGIFLGLEMPNVHGFDLARRIRNSSWNKNTPIVIVTGRDDRETMKEAFALGATFFSRSRWINTS